MESHLQAREPLPSGTCRSQLLLRKRFEGESVLAELGCMLLCLGNDEEESVHISLQLGETCLHSVSAC